MNFKKKMATSQSSLKCHWDVFLCYEPLQQPPRDRIQELLCYGTSGLAETLFATPLLFQSQGRQNLWFAKVIKDPEGSRVKQLDFRVPKGQSAISNVAQRRQKCAYSFSVPFFWLTYKSYFLSLVMMMMMVVVVVGNSKENLLHLSFGS
ncbi:hypothetical protein M0804_000538 [Polistes exclamans]|nr:hypothetical protein M0804_000538 [Polistes exclamans]